STGVNLGIDHPVAPPIVEAQFSEELGREVGLSSHMSVTKEIQLARLNLGAKLGGIITYIYGLSEKQFAYILCIFALVSEPFKIAKHNSCYDVEQEVIG